MPAFRKGLQVELTYLNSLGDVGLARCLWLYFAGAPAVETFVNLEPDHGPAVPPATIKTTAFPGCGLDSGAATAYAPEPH
jgi:hypothetical protein